MGTAVIQHIQHNEVNIFFPDTFRKTDQIVKINLTSLLKIKGFYSRSTILFLCQQKIKSKWKNVSSCMLWE